MYSSSKHYNYTTLIMIFFLRKHEKNKKKKKGVCFAFCTLFKSGFIVAISQYFHN